MRGVASLKVRGGTGESITGDQDSITEIFGGVRDRATTVERVVITFSGGSVTQIRAFDESRMNLVGTGFNFPYGEIVPLLGVPTGELADRTPISIDFGRASTASIVLVPAVPSPSPLGLSILVALLIASMAGFILRARR